MPSSGSSLGDQSTAHISSLLFSLLQFSYPTAELDRLLREDTTAGQSQLLCNPAQDHLLALTAG